MGAFGPIHLSHSCLCFVFFVPFVQEALQSFAFLVFVVFCVTASVYLFFILPETKNKTFMDISQSFAKINKVPVSSPGHEMEMVLSINNSDKVQAAEKTQMSNNSL